MPRPTGLPLLVFALLPALCRAQDSNFGAAKVQRFQSTSAGGKRAAKNGACVEIKLKAFPKDLGGDRKEDYLKGLMAPLMNGFSGAWSLKYSDFGEGLPADSRPPRTMGNDTDAHLFRVGPLIFDKDLTHGDENEARCILAHEAGHALGGHTEKRKPVWEKAVARCRQIPQSVYDKRIQDEFGGCSKTRMVGNGTECEALNGAMIQDCANEVPEYADLRVQQESEADRRMVDLIDAGTKRDGWACWEALANMPEAPRKPGEHDFHPPAAERAKAVRAYMKSLGAKDPCGVNP